MNCEQKLAALEIEHESLARENADLKQRLDAAIDALFKAKDIIDEALEA